MQSQPDIERVETVSEVELSSDEEEVRVVTKMGKTTLKPTEINKNWIKETFGQVDSDRVDTVSEFDLSSQDKEQVRVATMRENAKYWMSKYKKLEMDKFDAVPQLKHSQD